MTSRKFGQIEISKRGPAGLNVYMTIDKFSLWITDFTLDNATKLNEIGSCDCLEQLCSKVRTALELDQHKDLVLYMHGKQLIEDSEMPIHDLGITRFLEDGLKYDVEYITLKKDDVKHFFSRKVADDLKSEIAKRGLGDRVSIYTDDGHNLLKENAIGEAVLQERRPNFCLKNLQANGYIILQIDITTDNPDY